MNIYKTFSVYIFNNILNAAIPFILLPILTSYLSLADYGILTNVEVFIKFTMPFILLGINGAINTAYFRNKREDFPSYVTSGLFVSIIGCLVIFLVLSVGGFFIESQFRTPYKWVMITPLFCICQTITMVALVLYQSSKQPFKYGAMQIGSTITNFSFSLFFVIAMKMGWEGRLTGVLLSYILIAFIAIYTLKSREFLSKNISKEYIKDILKFGLPLIPYSLSAPIIQFLDRFLITKYIGIDSSGLYNVGYQIGISVSLITFAFNQAYAPILLESLGKLTEKRKKSIVKNSYLIMLFFLFLVLGLYVITPFIFKFLIKNPAFANSKNFVFLISLGSAFAGMNNLVINFIFYMKKTKVLTTITIINAGLSLVFNLIFIKYLGTIGAAYTYLITNILLFLSIWIYSNRVFPMPWLSFNK